MPASNRTNRTIQTAVRDGRSRQSENRARRSTGKGACPTAATRNNFGPGFSWMVSSKQTFPPDRLRPGQIAGGFLKPLGDAGRHGGLRGVVPQQLLHIGEFTAGRLLSLVLGSLLLLFLGKFGLVFQDLAS